jgi:hypothetical protein
MRQDKVQMSKKKRQPKTVTKTLNVPVAPSPVVQGKVFATFLDEAQKIGNELNARRAMQNEIGVYLAEKGLVSDFEAWRAARPTGR